MKKRRLKPVDVSASFPGGFGKSLLTVCGTSAKAIANELKWPKNLTVDSL